MGDSETRDELDDETLGGPGLASASQPDPRATISVIGPIAPEPPEARIWAVLREAVPCGLFGFGRTVPGRVFGPCERVGATRQEQGRRFAYSRMCVGRARSPGDYTARRRS